MDSQVASKVEAKPNMASLPKLRWGSSQYRRATRAAGTHPDDLLNVESLHLAAVEGRAGPFWVQHCEVGD